MKLSRKKLVCIIFGNCAAEVQANILRKENEFSKICEIIYIRSFIHPTKGASKVPYDKVRKCSLLLLQRGHLQFPEFYNDLPSSCRKISFPILRLDSLWPLQRMDPRNKPEPKNGFEMGRYPYGDLLVIKLLKKGLTPDQVLKKYMSSNINELVNLDKTHRRNLANWKELDSKCDLPLMRYVKENFNKERLFLTVNHPCPKLLVMQINLILESLGMSGLSVEVISDINKKPPLSKIHLPIHPQVIRHFNLEWADIDIKYRYYDGNWYGFEEYLKRYIEFR